MATSSKVLVADLPLQGMDVDHARKCLPPHVAYRTGLVRLPNHQMIFFRDRDLIRKVGHGIEDDRTRDCNQTNIEPFRDSMEEAPVLEQDAVDTRSAEQVLEYEWLCLVPYSTIDLISLLCLLRFRVSVNANQGLLWCSFSSGWYNSLILRRAPKFLLKS